MNVLEAIRGRRSIRKYQDRQIPREDLEKILEAGSFAPNAGGGQRAILVGVHGLRCLWPGELPLQRAGCLLLRGEHGPGRL